MSLLSPSNREEADARVFLHAKRISANTFRKVVIKTVDTDVLVLGISQFHYLKERLEELWIDLGTGKNRRFYPVQKIY